MRFERLEPRTMLAGPAPSAGEFRINVYTSSDQHFARVASDSSGDFVVAWLGQGSSGNGVYADTFSAAGAVKSGDLLVAKPLSGFTFVSLPAEPPAVAMDSAGDFVIAWDVYTGLDSSGFGQYAIYAQRYSAAGVTQGGQFRVSAAGTSAANPSMAMDSAGDFVIA